MSFVVATIIRDGSCNVITNCFSCSPDIDITSADFYGEFSDGKFDEEPVLDDDRHTFIKVLASSSKTETTKVLTASLISDTPIHWGFVIAVRNIYALLLPLQFTEGHPLY